MLVTQRYGVVWVAALLAAAATGAEARGDDRIFVEDRPDPYLVWTRIADFSPSLRAVECAELSPDGRWAVSASKFGQRLILWRVADGGLVWEKTFGAEIECVTFSPDGNHIATGDEEYMLRIWDRKTGEMLREEEHSSAIDGIAWSSDGRWVATGNESGELSLWLTDDWTLRQQKAFGSTINSIDFSQDDERLAIGGNIKTPQPDGTRKYTGFVYLVEREGLEIIQDFGEYAASVKSVRLSGDEEMVAAGSFDQTVRVFDVDTGDTLFQKSMGSQVEAVAFQPNGQFLVVGDHERRLTFFRVGDFKEVLRLRSPRSEYIHFSPDGRLMLTSHEDSGVIMLHLFHSSTRHTPGLYQKLSSQILGNRDLAP